MWDVCLATEVLQVLWGKIFHLQLFPSSCPLSHTCQSIFLSVSVITRERTTIYLVSFHRSCSCSLNSSKNSYSPSLTFPNQQHLFVAKPLLLTRGDQINKSSTHFTPFPAHLRSLVTLPVDWMMQSTRVFNVFIIKVLGQFTPPWKDMDQFVGLFDFLIFHCFKEQQ